MSFPVQVQITFPLRSTPLWLHIGSLASLGLAIGLLFISLVADARDFTPYSRTLVPGIVFAFLIAVYLSVCALRRIRIEHRKSDRAFSATSCESASLFENVLDGILILDNDANCLDANPAAACILRVSRADLIGKCIQTFLPNCSKFSERWGIFLEVNHKRGRTKMVAGDGTDVFVDICAAVDYLPGRHLVILCDVTEQKHVEQALQQSEERFQYVANHIQEIIWTMDAETKELVYANEAYAKTTGYSVDSLREDPSSYRELIHPQDRIRILSKLQEVADAGSLDEEFRFINANGAERWIWVKAHAIRENGNTRWIVGTAQDITSRKEAERQIAESLDVAEAARAEAEALRKATLALSQNLSMDSVLDTLLLCLRDLVPFDQATILFVDDPTHLMVAREASVHGIDRSGFVLSALDNVFLQRILFEHKAVLLPETKIEPDWKDDPPFDQVRSWLAIPIIAIGTVIGILSLSSKSPSAFITEHLRLAKSLAVSAAVAIRNARTHERAAIYAAELELRLKAGEIDRQVR